MLRFIHITDTHIGPTPDFELYHRNTYQETEWLVEYLNNHLPFTPDFVVHTGDVLNQPSESAAMLAQSIFGQLRYPAYYVVGNHDSRGLLRQYLMGQPNTPHLLFYDFRQGETHFLVLDTPAEIDPQGHITDEQLNWLTETCARSDARSLVILLHHLPLRIYVPWYDLKMRIMNADALFAALRPYRDRLHGIFFGHIHRAFTGYRDGILCSAPASVAGQIHTWPTDESPNFDLETRGGFAIVTLDDKQVTVTHHTLPERK